MARRHTAPKTRVDRGPAKPRPKRRVSTKSATRLTLSAIMLFESSACLLLALRNIPLDWRAGALAVLLPFLSWLTVQLTVRYLRADALLAMLMSFLCGVGIVLLYGLAPERGIRQAWVYGGGIAVYAFAVMAIRLIKDWRALSWLLILGGLVLLLLPVAIGQETNGAKNWFSIPVFGSFQPSELVKLFVVIVLAQSFSSLRGVRGMIPGLVFGIACLGILMLQKDLGTALLYYLVTLLLYWAASSNLPLTLVGAAGGVGAAILGYNMFSHVKTRVAIWRNPWSDALGKGYQIVQALTAIGSGGLLGLGLGMGKSHSIPAYSTDLIFAVLCEQFGILFGLGVVAIYVLITLRGIAISLQARTAFLSLLALACSLFIGLQAFIIIGGVIKLIPLTGITMPFVSYGGTSLVSCMGMIGLLGGVSALNAEARDSDARLAEGMETLP